MTFDRACFASAVLLLALAPAGCLRPDTQPEGRIEACPMPDASCAARSAALEQQIARLQQDLDAREAGLQGASLSHADLVRKVDELTSLNAEITERLRTAGQNVAQLAVERQGLADALAAARSRLEALDRPGVEPPAQPSKTDLPAPPSPAAPIRAAAEGKDAVAVQPAD